MPLRPTRRFMPPSVSAKNKTPKRTGTVTGRYDVSDDTSPYDKLLNVPGQGGNARRVRSTASQLLPQLNSLEREFFTLVKKGDVQGVEKFLKSNQGFNINCQNYKGYTPLVTAIQLENYHMVTFLLGYPGIYYGDAVLQAVQTGQLPMVELIMEYDQCDSDVSMAYSTAEHSADFSPDMTPLKLAAQNEHYLITRWLLQIGHTIEKPHSPDCFCEGRCKLRKLGESLSRSVSRLNSYKAVTNQCFIGLTSKDPILTAFQMSEDLRKCAGIEREFKQEYLDLAENCSQYAVDLLAECRTTEEVHRILDKSTDWARDHEIDRFARVKLALKFEQKGFVAHPKSQQVMRSAWLDGWHDWKSLTFAGKLIRLFPRIICLPILAVLYMVYPNLPYIRTLKTPLNKFFSFAASYAIFLILLMTQNMLDKHGNRGPPATGLEYFIIIYIVGFSWMKFKSLWYSGIRSIRRDRWDIFDLTLILVFVTTFVCWGWSYEQLKFVSQEEKTQERKFWHQHDPTLISEACYAIAFIMAITKLMFFFQIGQHFGPLQVSLSRMMSDIAVFLVLFIFIMFAFAVGLYKLYHHYTGQVRRIGDSVVKQENAFSSIVLSLHTLYWAVYGYSPPYFADVVLSEHVYHEDNHTYINLNEHRFTEVVGQTIFAVYYVVGVIILINLLIAMTSNSFSSVQENADTEWKFARTKIWMHFFQKGNTLPPPFNMIPSPKSLVRLFHWLYLKCFCCLKSQNEARFSATRCCYIYTEDEQLIDDLDDSDYKYKLLVAKLLQRYAVSRVKKREDGFVSMQDLDHLNHRINELKHKVNGGNKASSSTSAPPPPPKSRSGVNTKF